MKKTFSAGLGLALALSMVPAASAGGAGKAVEETVEFVLKKFGKKAVQGGAGKLAARLSSAAARHGDDVLHAVRRVGPNALGLADSAGSHAPRLMRLVARHGDDTVRVFSRPKAMTLLARYGDDAAEVLVKHKSIAEPLVEHLGQPAVKALGALGERGGRRLAMMGQGELAAIGRTPELLGVIARHGDSAMEFIWRHKGVLAGSAALAAFLANPEPYLNGTARLVDTVAQTAIKPVAVAAGNVAQEAAGFVRWSLTIVLVGLAVAMVLAMRSRALARPWLRSAGGVAGKNLAKVAAGVPHSN